MLVVYQFVTFEQTSITTLPPNEQQVQVIERQTPTPLPTPAPTATPEEPTGWVITSDLSTWDGGIDELFGKCTGCHGTSGGLSVETYDDLLKGGKSGPGVVPGDAEASQVVIKMQGAHPVKFTEAELQTVIDWINAGAPEK